MENCNVNILGTEYHIKFKEMKDDTIDGYCDYSSKQIVIRSDNEYKLGDFEELQKKQLRHEIIHAFMAESGLQSNWEHNIEFGHEETTVDWFAIQAPKIYKAFLEIGIIDVPKIDKGVSYSSISDLVDLAGTIALSKGASTSMEPSEFVALIHAEVSEIIEEFRDGRKATETYHSSDGKPRGVPYEIADVIIYCFIMSDFYGIDLEKAILEKMEYNKTRPYKHGKSF